MSGRVQVLTYRRQPISRTYWDRLSASSSGDVENIGEWMFAEVGQYRYSSAGMEALSLKYDGAVNVWIRSKAALILEETDMGADSDPASGGVQDHPPRASIAYVSKMESRSKRTSGANGPLDSAQYL
eukprot:jgi/Tetstr1/443069/TSEL_031127.t1